MTAATAATHGVTAETETRVATGFTDLNETTDSTNETLNETTDSTNETLNETTDSTNETLNDTTNSTTDTVNETLNETTDSTNETLNDTTNSTTDTVNETLNETTDSTNETLNETTDTVNETTDAELLSAGEDLLNATESVLSGAQETTADLLNALETSSGGAAEGDSRTSVERGAPTPAVTEPGTTSAVARSEDDGTTGATDGSERDGSSIPVPGAIAVGAAIASAGGAVALVLGDGGATAGSSRSVRASARAAAASTRSWLGRTAGRLWRTAAAFKYSRWDDSDPLEHDGRQRVFDEIEDAPGIYLSKLDERTDDSLSTLRHHLRILESEDLITTEKIRGKRRYFPAGRGGEDPALVAAMDDPATAGILTTLAEAGPSSGGDLAAELDRDPSTVSHHLSRLEEAGLIERERDGRAVVNRLSDTAAMGLRDAAPAPPEPAAPADD